MPSGRLGLVAPILALLVALGGLVGSGAWAHARDAASRAAADGGHPAAEQASDSASPSEAATVVRAAGDHLRNLAAPPGPLLVLLGFAAAAAGASWSGAAALVPAAVPSRTTAHVRRRGPPSRV
jgi:hypothetical protein